MSNGQPAQFYRHTIRQRLVWGYLTVGVLVLLACGVAIWQINRLVGAVDTLQVARQRATTALKVQQSSTQLVAVVNRFMQTEESAMFDAQVTAAVDDLRACQPALDALTEGAQGDETAYPALARVNSRVESVIGIADTMLRQARAGQWYNAKVRLGVLQRDQQQLTRDADNLAELAGVMEALAAQQVDSARRAAVVYPAMGVLLSLVIGVWVTGRTLRSIARPVEQLTQGAARLAAGSLDTRVAVESADELGQLAATFNQMADRLQASHADLERRVAERTADLAMLNRLGRELTATLDMRQVVKQLLEAITEIIGAEDASVWLWDKENTGWLVCQTILHAWAGAPHHLRLPPGQGIAGWAAQTGQSAMVSYAPEDYRFFSGIDRQIGFRTASLLAVPLCARDKVIGVLEVVNKFAGAFNDDDCKLAETLAASAAIALDNAELVDALRQHAAELQARNEELDAFAHTVAHDLQNPLGIIVGFARVLQTDYSGLSGQDLLRYLRLIAQNGQKMSNIIDELFLLASVRKREVKTSPLDMARIVAEAQGRLIDLAEQYRPEFVLPEAWPAALGYGPWVEEVWVNYLSNALKYGGRPPRIELGADEVSGTCESATHLMVRFWVRDNGAGLPPEEQARLFTPFTRLDQARARGHGLGLSIVRRIVEKLGGQVGVESAPGAGSTFWFTLPAA